MTIEQPKHLTAKEAKEATANSTVMLEKQFEEIMEAIGYAVRNGNYFVEWKSGIGRANRKKLIELGYTVNSWIVSWEE